MRFGEMLRRHSRGGEVLTIQQIPGRIRAPVCAELKVRSHHLRNTGGEAQAGQRVARAIEIVSSQCQGKLVDVIAVDRLALFRVFGAEQGRVPVKGALFETRPEFRWNINSPRRANRNLDTLQNVLKKPRTWD